MPQLRDSDEQKWPSYEDVSERCGGLVGTAQVGCKLVGKPSCSRKLPGVKQLGDVQKFILDLELDRCNVGRSEEADGTIRESQQRVELLAARTGLWSLSSRWRCLSTFTVSNSLPRVLHEPPDYIS